MIRQGLGRGWGRVRGGVGEGLERGWRRVGAYPAILQKPCRKRSLSQIASSLIHLLGLDEYAGEWRCTFFRRD